jgi:hypothetical protein
MKKQKTVRTSDGSIEISLRSLAVYDLGFESDDQRIGRLKTTVVISEGLITKNVVSVNYFRESCYPI